MAKAIVLLVVHINRDFHKPSSWQVEGGFVRYAAGTISHTALARSISKEAKRSQPLRLT